MKILQIPFHYFPDAVGGTEVYVWSLSRHLKQQGVDVEIAAPGEKSEGYIHDGMRVHRVGVTSSPADLAALYGAGDPRSTQEFSRILDLTCPDVVHFHAMSPAVSHHVMHEVKKRGIPAVFTCHIPGITCPRGTLLYNGTEVCDGVWNLQKCTSCTMQDKGLPPAVGNIVARMPSFIATSLADRGIRGSVATALRMRALHETSHQARMRFFDDADRVVAVSGWLRDVLVANGVAPGKIVLCRHGVTQTSRSQAEPPHKDDGVIRLAFLGRLSAIKGAHVVLSALSRRPNLPIALDLFGIVQDEPDYVRKLTNQIQRDSRVRLLPPLANNDVVRTLAGYDALVVPSQWMETGPLVVYDAFLAGIPVIGSRRGGLLELIANEGDGLLVEPGDPEAWAAAIERFASDPVLRKLLRAGVRSPRSMAEVAAEMSTLYRDVQVGASELHHV